MDTTILKQINRQIRNKRPLLSDGDVCSVFKTGDLLEIGFLSRQCRNDLNGSCLMCDYGYMHHTAPIQRYIKEMKDILAVLSDNVDYLLLCTNGSFLDSYQISTDLLKMILLEAQMSSIPHIIIETHYTDVTEEKLNIINQTINKPITIEMGLETINQKYQKTLFMKGIDFPKYIDTIQLIKKYNYSIELNIMVGLPFLSPKQQIDDSIKTIEWAVQHECTPILFPINIKYFTFLRYLYDNKKYVPISLWLVIELLDNLSDKALERIVVAWYGNRDESYSKDYPTIMPQDCDLCHSLLLQFFKDLHRTNNVKERRALITNLFNKSHCNCAANTRKSLKQPDSNYDKNYCNLLTQLNKDFTFFDKGKGT